MLNTILLWGRRMYVNWFILAILALVPVQITNSDQESAHVVEQAVHDFLELINKKDCKKALALQPKYTMINCADISNFEVLKVKMEMMINENKAYVYVKARYTESNMPKTFENRIILTKTGSKWIIQNNQLTNLENNKVDYTKEEKIDNSSTHIIPAQPSQIIRKNSLNKTLTYGSQRILETCWTRQELNGNPVDKKIVSLPVADRTPPVRTIARYHNPPLPDYLQQSIRYVVPNSDIKLVALTFDLCEQTHEKSGYDADLVNYLRQHRVKATFFAGGKWMRSHPDKAMQLMADPLFEIGNHAWTHGNLRVLQGHKMDEQIIWTQAQYELLWENLKNQRCVINAGIHEMNLIPRVPATFRFPYGTCSTESLNAVNKAGLAAVQWNIVTGDPAKKQSATGIAKIILDQIKPGSIIIAHANGRGWNTAAALPLFIPKLLQMGYEFVTVSELLNAGKSVTEDTCYEVRPNDNLHYDKIFGEGT